MNIALISHSSRVAGGEMMLLNLAKLISQNSTHKVYFIYPAGIKDDIKLIDLPSNITLIGTSLEDWYINANEGSYGQSDVFRRKVISSLDEHKDLFTRLGIDLVVVNTLTRIGPVIASVELGIPYILWAHGVIDSYYYDNGVSPYKVSLDKALIRLSTHTITCSKWVTDYFVNLTGAKNIQTVYNWTDVNRGCISTWKRDKQPCSFVCLNTMDPHKGYEVLLSASVLLASKGCAFTVDIYADGRLKEWIIDYIRNKDMDKYVRYKGRRLDISSIYQATDCLVTPSFVEPFGMTIIEAMSFGKPVIASHSGGPDEIIIDTQTGLLAKVADPVDFARCMEMIIANPQSAERMGLNGYNRYKDLFSTEAASKTILPVIESVKQSFSGYSDDQKLLSSLVKVPLMEYQSLRANGSFPTINSTQIVTTKPLKGKFRIIIHITLDTLTFIHLLFGTHQMQIKGRGMVKLFSMRGQLLRVVDFSLGLIRDSEWFCIPITPIEKVKGKYIVAEISTSVSEENMAISLYQTRIENPIKRIIRFCLSRSCQCYSWVCIHLE